MMRHFMQCERLVSHSSLGAYVAIRGEADPVAILEWAHQLKRSLCLPVMKDEGLIFCPWQPGENLRLNRHGVPEPDSSEATFPSLLLIPLLAFDAEGMRLGYGGGYYDRTLAKEEYRHSLRIGLAFHVQKSEGLPQQPHDVRLHGVLTEKGVMWV